MNLSWKQLLVLGGATTVVVVGSILGYKYVTTEKGQGQPRDSGEASASSKSATAKKKAPAKSGKKKSAEKTPKDSTTESPAVEKTSSTATASKVADIMDQCDLSTADLHKLPVEEKQRVFYALLTKGEFLLGQADGRSLPRALDYFSKAVAIVPNPGEVVAAFEKTLPPPLFSALLDRIQVDIHAKIGDYFKSMTPPGGKVAFKEEPTQKTNGDNKSGQEGDVPMRKVFRPYAARSLAVGDRLWEETADVTAPLLDTLDERRCEYCLCSPQQTDKMVSCPACRRPLFCSESCRDQSLAVLHPFFCQPDETVLEAMEELREHCRENSTSLPLLMLRYIAMLLGEELRGNGAAANGPFAHYDHLYPVFNAPTTMDRQEAKLLRRIFSFSNQEIVEFLSDEIYAAMKNTLARHTTVLGGEYPTNTNDDQDLIPETRRVAGCKGEAQSFFHLAAHLAHDCDPNCVLVPTDGRHVHLVALKNISEGDPLTISYLPFAEDTSPSTRQLQLMRIFGFNCLCDLCEAGLPIAA